MVGFRRNKLKIIFTAALCIAVAGIWFGMGAVKVKLPTLKEMNVSKMTSSFQPVYAGQSWVPDMPADPSGFAPVMENDRYVMSLDPASNLIAIREKQSGFQWRSNPLEEQLKLETVKGLLRSNLQSPFILEYAEEGSSERKATNALNPKVKVNRIRYAKGIQVTYQFTDLNIDFALQYELTDLGFKAIIPVESIHESGINHIIAIGLLPFFGAAPKSETDGYLFVPDGSGALIRFRPDRPLIGDGYYNPVYGNDFTNLRDDLDKVPREKILYPVYGMKRGDHAFLSVITEGEYASWIRALPAGMVSTYHSIYTNFIYRQEYGQRFSKLSAPVLSFQKELLKKDRVVEYRFLSGKSADYSGMAREYRSYLINTGQLVPRLKPVAHIPLSLWIMGGDSIKKFNSYHYVPLTTFKQAEQMVDGLFSGGIKNMMVNYFGWMDGGYYDMAKQFPVESALGGRNDAVSFIQHAHQHGFKVLFEDDLVSIDKEKLGLNARTNGIRNIDGTVARDPFGNFFLNPVLSLGFLHNVVPQLKKMGVDGIVHNWFGDSVFTDFNSVSRSDRDETAYYYQSGLEYSRNQLGMSGIYDGNVYSLKNVDYISWMTMDSSHDLIADETVPFYPMVVHGSIGYSATPGNVRRNNVKDELLRDIEYGALPAFYLTSDNPWKMKDLASNFLYSSEYAIWKDRVIEEYKKFDQLSSIYHFQMINHEKISEGVFGTTYEDGTRVVVDYNSHDFKVIKGGSHENGG